MRKLIFTLIMLLWGILIALSMQRLTETIPNTYIHNDFYVYYIAAKLLANGNPIYGVTEAFKEIKLDYNLLFHWSTGYVYPPLTALFFIPFTLLPPTLAAWIWFGFNLTIFSLWVNWITKKLPSHWCLLYILTFPPAIHSLTSGQVNFVLLWLLSFYILGGKTIERSLSLGLAILMKVYPGFFLLGELITRHTRRVLSTGVVILVGLLIPMVFGKLDSTIDYFLRVLPNLQRDRDGYFIHQSATAVLLRFTASPDKINSFLSETVIKSLTTTALFIVIGCLIIWTAKRKTFRMLEKFVWLNGISLVSGRMTYWNFLPTLLGSLYLLKNENLLTRTQRFLLWFSIILSNLAWQTTYWFYQTLPVNTWWQRFAFGLSTSVGFMSVLIQTLILLQCTRNNHNI